MKLEDHFQLAYRSVLRHRLRSALNMLGMIVGVAAVIVLTSLGLGARNEVEREIERLGTNLLIVQPLGRTSGALRDASAGHHRVSESDARALALEVADVELAVPVVVGQVTLISREYNWTSPVIGTHPGYLAARDWKLAEGRDFTLREVEGGAKVALLGKTAATKLAPLGSILGSTVRMDEVPFRIIGVLEEKGHSANGADQDDTVVAPISTVKSRVLGGYFAENRSAVQYILIKVRERADVDVVAEEISRVLKHRHGIGEKSAADFNVRDPIASLSASRNASETLTLFLACIAAVSLIVGGISIMNITLVSVSERAQEIGIRMVVGADRNDVRLQFLVEAAGVALIGGALGAQIGVVSALALEALLDWHIQVSPWICLGALTFSALVGLASGLYPAFKASALDPMDAVRR